MKNADSNASFSSATAATESLGFSNSDFKTGLKSDLRERVALCNII